MMRKKNMKTAAIIVLLVLIPINSYADDKEIVTRTGQPTGLYVHENKPLPTWTSQERMTDTTPGVYVDPQMASVGGRNIQNIGQSIQNTGFQMASILASREQAAGESELETRLSDIGTRVSLGKDYSETAFIKYQMQIEQAISESASFISRPGARRRFKNWANGRAAILRNEMLINFTQKRKGAGLPEFDSSFIEKVTKTDATGESDFFSNMGKGVYFVLDKNAKQTNNDEMFSKVASRPWQRYNRRVIFDVENSTDGFELLVECSKWQFFPHTSGVVSLCKEATNDINNKQLQAKNISISDASFSNPEIYTSRNIGLGVTSCLIKLKITYNTEASSGNNTKGKS